MPHSPTNIPKTPFSLFSWHPLEAIRKKGRDAAHCPTKREMSTEILDAGDGVTIPMPLRSRLRSLLHGTHWHRPHGWGHATRVALQRGTSSKCKNWAVYENQRRTAHEFTIPAQVITLNLEHNLPQNIDLTSSQSEAWQPMQAKENTKSGSQWHWNFAV